MILYRLLYDFLLLLLLLLFYIDCYMISYCYYCYYDFI